MAPAKRQLRDQSVCTPSQRLQILEVKAAHTAMSRGRASPCKHAAYDRSVSTQIGPFQLVAHGSSASRPRATAGMPRVRDIPVCMRCPAENSTSGVPGWTRRPARPSLPLAKAMPVSMFLRSTGMSSADACLLEGRQRAQRQHLLRAVGAQAHLNRQDDDLKDLKQEIYDPCTGCAHPICSG